MPFLLPPVTLSHSIFFHLISLSRTPVSSSPPPSLIPTPPPKSSRHSFRPSVTSVQLVIHRQPLSFSLLCHSAAALPPSPSRRCVASLKKISAITAAVFLFQQCRTAVCVLSLLPVAADVSESPPPLLDRCLPAAAADRTLLLRRDLPRHCCSLLFALSSCQFAAAAVRPGPATACSSSIDLSLNLFSIPEITRRLHSLILSALSLL